MSKSLAALTATLFLAASPVVASEPANPSPECAADAPVALRVQSALGKADRPAAQVTNDANRLSETQFVLAHIRPGDRVLDIGAGQGYASMILSAAVCGGHVDSQNPQSWVDYYKMAPARDAMAAARPNISLLTVDFDKIPAPTERYDAIFIGTVYHDTYNEPGHDTAKLTALLKSLVKPGGVIILTDHASKTGQGALDTNTLHRIEKAQVLGDFAAAGFVVAEDSPALANPADDHSKNVFDPAIRGHTDRMALVFRRP